MCNGTCVNDRCLETLFAEVYDGGAGPPQYLVEAAVAADGTRAYWGDLQGSVRAVSLADHATTTLGSAAAAVLVADTTSVYWTTGGERGNCFRRPSVAVD
jgi:hypothetical protein